MKLKLLIYCFFVLSNFRLQGQFLFSSLGTKEGMSSRDVKDACKDKDGFIWFGTSNGLNRYDGSGFKIYSRQYKNSRSLTSDIINCVSEVDGNIWIGTPTGLFVLDKKMDTIRPVLFTPNRSTGVLKFEKDFENKTWIITDHRIFILNKGIPEPIEKTYPGTARLVTYKTFNTVERDSFRKGIWFSADNNLFFFHQQSGLFFSQENNPYNWSIFQTGHAISLAVDATGKIWFITSLLPYLQLFDFTTNTSSRIMDSGFEYPKVLKSVNAVGKLMTDSKGRIWISTWGGELLMNIGPNKIINISEQSITGYKPAFTVFETIYSDDAGNDWLLGKDGANKIWGNSVFDYVTQLKYNPVKDKIREFAAINRVVKAGPHEWWICSEAGLHRYNSVSKIQTRTIISPDNYRANRFFHAIFYRNEWWFATGDGILILNPVSNRFRKFTHYAKGYEIKNKSVTNLLVDKKGKLWFSVWNDALYRYDPVTSQTVRYDGHDAGQGDIRTLNCSSASEDIEGNIWITSQLLRKFEITKEKWVKPYLPVHKELFEQEDKFGVAEDKNGNVWIGVSKKGVYCLNKKGNVIDSINSVNGLSSDLVYELCIDKYNRLWVVTSEAVHFVNLENKHVSTLDFRAPYPFGDFWPVLRAEDSLLAVTYNDITCFVNLDKLGEKLQKKKPLITSIKVFETEIPFDFSKPELSLKHSQNFFTIYFSSPHHKEIPSIQYAYKLEGLNIDWVYCGKRQVASYSNVSNGHYRFLVKSTNSNGEWSDAIAIVEINIKAPFWKTAWFISLVVLLALTILWLLYKRYVARNKKKIIEKTIDYFANSVYGENSVNEICWDIARNCISQLQFEDCVVYLIDEKTNRLVQKAAYGPKNPKGHEIENPIEVEMGNGIVGTVALTGKPLLIADTSKDERYVVDDVARLSELAVPILHENKVIGVIDSEHPQKNFFSHEHLKALSTIASISANKIAEAQAEASAKENEIKLLEINRMLAESQLMALRAQMNPHFVFNCLNSIQECIVTQKYGEASNYLNKFSKLFRMVLNNSGRNLVTLEEEAEVLRLYLELELMRFENSFSYTIHIDEELDQEEIMIPSMLVQPYVENALWHGLMHQEGERKLAISFEKISDEVFGCIIDDNGIGRKKSFELKQQQSKAKRHESKGLKITKDRLDVLRKQGYHASLEIIDKYDAQQNPTGTKINIELSTDLVH